MDTIIPITGCSEWRREYHYAVYEHRVTGPDGMTYSRSFIVIKNSYGVIVRFTRLHNFSGVYESWVFRPLASDVKVKLHYICMMLNYILIDHYDTFKIDHIFQITKDALKCFFMDYALGKKQDGGFRSSQSIEKCVNSVVQFFGKLSCKYDGYVVLKKDDLYAEHSYYTRKGNLVKQLAPDFQVRGIAKPQEIFRDLPTKIFQILLNLATRYAPDIAFAVGLQAFAGLRPGEVCNVRQENSPQGRGVLITMRESKMVRMEIDLTAEHSMRSDSVICGKIKKERKQYVYPPFLDAIKILYENHQEFLASHSYEKEFCPMFINGSGMAMTYNDYYRRFRKLIEEHLRPVLLHHEDPECRIYGQLLCENRLGPHALRHWFSVQLALRGEDVAQIQFWRGDRNPESAFVYLRDKGDLIGELAKANDLLAGLLMREGKRGYGGS